MLYVTRPPAAEHICQRIAGLIAQHAMPIGGAETPGPALHSPLGILVIRLRRFGDLLLSTPTLRALRLAYPGARIDVLVAAGFHQVLINNPHIDRLLVLEPGWLGMVRMLRACRYGHYDTVVDLQSSLRTLLFVLASAARVRVGWQKRWVRDWAYNRVVPGWNDPVYVARNTLRAAAAVGVAPPPDLKLDLAISSADRARVASLCERAALDSQRPVVALSVVANVPRKQWPPEHYAALADRLIQAYGTQIILTSGVAEIEQVRAVVTRMRERPALWNYGATTIQELGALYERCHLWVGNDGGPKHVATAAGCPTIVIIKAGDERFWTDCTPGSLQMAVQPGDGASALDLGAVTVEQVYECASQYLDSRGHPHDDGRSVRGADEDR